MTERIDHVAEADVLLEDARDYSGEGEFAQADLAVKSAQVHATLALVEQQRIANLIAFDRTGVEFNGYGRRISSEDDIREGLGLND